LREIGIEKTWLQAAEPAAQPVRAASAPAAATATAPAAAPPIREAAMDGVAPVRDQKPAPAAAPTPSRPAARPSVPAPAAREQAQPPAQPVEAARDFDALREQVIQCTACGLCNGRRHAVFGMGGRPARWMVVGEAPGEQEDRQGLPFVGRSGQLLDAMLASVGLSREKDVFIANVIKCRPPGNRNPKPEEIAACSPYLMRQIELLKPERILVLG